MPSLDQIDSAYRQFLGRGVSPDEYGQYWSNFNGDYGTAIAQSPEAQTRSLAGRVSTTAPTPDVQQNAPSDGGAFQDVTAPGRQKVTPVPSYTPSTFDPMAPGSQPSAAGVGDPGNATNAVNGYYSQFLGRTAHPDEVAAWLGSGLDLGTIQNHIANSPEAQAFAQHGGAQPTAAPSTKTPYDGSSQSLLLNAALQRLSSLQQPIDRTNEDLYTKYALDRVTQLGGAPFSDQQSAALLTKNMEPLTQARDQAKQQAAEDLSRRGFTPTSGVFQDRMKAIDQAYERGVAGVTNSLNVQGIDQAQKNAAMQLQILDSLVNMGRMSRQEADQRSLEIVQTAGIPFNTDLQSLSALTTAGGNDNSSALISSLLNLGGLNLKGSQIQTDQNAQDSQAIGSVVGYIMAHHADFGF